MTKSKKFWAVSAFLSLAVMAFAGYSIYGHMSLHFSGDTIEVRPVPMPVPEEEDEDMTAAKAAALARMNQDDEEEKEEAKPARQTAAAKSEADKVKAVKTVFEYKDAKAKSVLIAGSFTSWKDKKMTKKDGVFSLLNGDKPLNSRPERTSLTRLPTTSETGSRAFSSSRNCGVKRMGHAPRFSSRGVLVWRIGRIGRVIIGRQLQSFRGADGNQHGVWRFGAFCSLFTGRDQ